MTLDLSKRAKCIVKMALGTDLGRNSRYRALSAFAIPYFDTVLKVLQALGVQMLARPISPLP